MRLCSARTLAYLIAKIWTGGVRIITCRTMVVGLQTIDQIIVRGRLIDTEGTHWSTEVIFSSSFLNIPIG